MIFVLFGKDTMKNSSTDANPCNRGMNIQCLDENHGGTTLAMMGLQKFLCHCFNEWHDGTMVRAEHVLFIRPCRPHSARCRQVSFFSSI